MLFEHVAVANGVGDRFMWDVEIVGGGVDVTAAREPSRMRQQMAQANLVISGSWIALLQES